MLARFSCVLALSLCAVPALAQNAGIGIGFGQGNASATSNAGNATSNATGGQGSATANGGGVTFNQGSVPANTRSDQFIEQRGGTLNTTRSTGSLRTTPSTFAPGLTAAGLESCLGSLSAGGSGVGFGITFATTTRDTGCDARLDARTLWSMNLRKAAVSRLCQKPEIAAAMPDVCPQVQPAQPVAGYYGAPVAQAAAIAPQLEPAPVGRGQRVIVIYRGQERSCDDYDGRRCLRWSR